MKLHEIYPHNKLLLFIGAVLMFIGTYLDNTNKAGFGVTVTLLIGALIFLLLSFRKPKQKKDVV
jgi:hypothetical protein